MSSTSTFGIDLGTTCSAIGLVRDGKPQLIEIDGDPLLPSVVSFPEGEDPLVGRPALNRLALDPERTIRSAKRHMGSEHRWEIGDRLISAPEVSALVLERLKREAEKATGLEARRAVITVPAWFTHGQRADTHRAAELAGWDTVRLVNEPTAAALAHAHGRDLRRRALVYDFGGGTFDVSLVDQDGEVVEVRASRGDTHLGGDDLDAALTERVLEELRGEDRDLFAAVERSTPARTRLQLAVQEAKHELSSSLKAPVRVPFLLDLDGQAMHFDGELSRETLEQAAAHLVERTVRCVDEVLEDAHLSAAEVDELLFVGGSTRLPLVWSTLHAHTGLEGSSAIAPDRAVALGAAIQAAIVDGSRVDGILIDVAPFSLSVAAAIDPAEELHPRMFCRVITPRNAPLPSRHSELFHTAWPGQEVVQIPVFQGSAPNPLRNTTLGEIVLEDLPPAPVGQDSRAISVEFRHDLDGMVAIRVTDVLSDRTVDGRIAAGGEEAASLRAKLIEQWQDGGFTPGDGNDPDPYLEREERAVASSGVPAPTGSDLEEARQAFDAVLARETELAEQHPERIFDLRKLAIAGREAHQSGDADGALRSYDELSDQLFELGVWL